MAVDDVKNCARLMKVAWGGFSFLATGGRVGPVRQGEAVGGMRCERLEGGWEVFRLEGISGLHGFWVVE